METNPLVRVLDDLGSAGTGGCPKRASQVAIRDAPMWVSLASMNVPGVKWPTRSTRRLTWSFPSCS